MNLIVKKFVFVCCASTLITSCTNKQISFDGANRESGSSITSGHSADAEGFSGFISASISSISTPFLRNIPQGSKLIVKGTGFTENIEVKISGVSCAITMMTSTTLNCTLAGLVNQITFTSIISSDVEVKIESPPVTLDSSLIEDPSADAQVAKAFALEEQLEQEEADANEVEESRIAEEYRMANLVDDYGNPLPAIEEN